MDGGELARIAQLNQKKNGHRIFFTILKLGSSNDLTTLQTLHKLLS